MEIDPWASKGIKNYDEICEKFGVWVEKKNYGRKYMGIERTTFLVDQKGIVAKIWRKVKVSGHVEDVLKVVETL